MLSRRLLFLFLTALFLVIPGGLSAQSGDPALLARMQQINAQLADMGLDIAIEQIEFFTIGGGRPSNRIHQQEFRWVANDPRRLADGTNITYLVDQSDGDTASGLSNAQTEGAIDRAMATWDSEKCLKKVDIVKRPDSGADPTSSTFSSDSAVSGPPSWRTSRTQAGCPARSSRRWAGPAEAAGSWRLRDLHLREPGWIALRHQRGQLSRQRPQRGLLQQHLRPGRHGQGGQSLGYQRFASGNRRRDGGPPRERPLTRAWSFRTAANSRHEPGLQWDPARPRSVDHAGMCTIWSRWPR